MDIHLCNQRLKLGCCLYRILALSLASPRICALGGYVHYAISALNRALCTPLNVGATATTNFGRIYVSQGSDKLLESTSYTAPPIGELTQLDGLIPGKHLTTGVGNLHICPAHFIVYEVAGLPSASLVFQCRVNSHGQKHVPRVHKQSGSVQRRPYKLRNRVLNLRASQLDLSAPT
ncbi:hypothetical protein GY45DRAFT_75145 [Cubamyces sp. BRFM 1775]|nr:hypothetical protein GY45DRAFT_75145 [Cubamyces sp. BRFM 1775]